MRHRLIHLHEEQAWQRGLAAKNAARGTEAGHAAALFNMAKARSLEVTIKEILQLSTFPARAETGCPPFIPNALLQGSPPFWRYPVLCFGVPDAERIYRPQGPTSLAAIERMSAAEVIQRVHGDAPFPPEEMLTAEEIGKFTPEQTLWLMGLA